MSDVRQCDNCTNLGDVQWDPWYAVEASKRFARLNFDDEGPWHFDNLDCLKQWVEARQNKERELKTRG